jgi:predicted O-linked N-acetylglucosamine transferase (SPINDLY family)
MMTLLIPWSLTSIHIILLIAIVFLVYSSHAHAKKTKENLTSKSKKSKSSSVSSPKNSYSAVSAKDADTFYTEAFTLVQQGHTTEAIRYMENLLSTYGTLALPYEHRPSLYSYYAVALVSPGTNRHDEAIEAFRNATVHTPEDLYTWLNMGELCMQTFRLTEAIAVFSKSLNHAAQSCRESSDFNECRYRSSIKIAPRLLRAMSWTATWQNYEYMSYVLERAANECHDNYRIQNGSLQDCQLETSGGLEYTDLNGGKQLLFEAMSPDSRNRENLFDRQIVPPVWNVAHAYRYQSRRLKVGILSSDFGIHPVSSLVRGLVQFLVTGRKIELFLFSLNPKPSFWGNNMTALVGVERYVDLSGLDMPTAALTISSHGIEILIDLNGHTMGNGLPVMSYRPAPVQMTYLGLPTTTGASFIDYLIGDPVASPPEHSSHYLERLSLLPLGYCYIANDFAQMQGDIVFTVGEHRASRSQLSLESGRPRSLSQEEMLLLATFSSPLKIDPLAFQTWLNILRLFPRSEFMMITFQGSEGSISRLRKIAKSVGINDVRLLESPLLPWIEHIYGKTAVDLALDSVLKNGHTTGLDAAWAGLPTISMGGGHVMSNRAAESIVSALAPGGVGLGLTYSLKEYEDIVTAVLGSSSNPGLAKSNTPWRLRLFRDYQQRLRLVSNLFDTPAFSRHFENVMQSTWELTSLESSLRLMRPRRRHKAFHIFAVASQSEARTSIRVGTAFDPTGPPTKWLPHESLQRNFVDRFGFDPHNPPQQVNHNNAGAGMLTRKHHHDLEQRSRDTSETTSLAKAVYASRQRSFYFQHSKLCSAAEQSRVTVHEPIDPSKLLHPLRVYYGVAASSQNIRLLRQQKWTLVGPTSEETALNGELWKPEIVRPIYEMEGLRNGSVSILYAGNVLAHLSLGDSMLYDSLTGIHMIICCA